MSQWFGGPGRKAGKTPGGAPDGSADFSRGRGARPIRPAANPPRPAANPPRNRPQADYNQELISDPRQPAANEFARPASIPPRGSQGMPPAQPSFEDWVDEPQSPPQQQYRTQAPRTQPYDQQVDDEYIADDSEFPERVEFKKRLVALIFDFLACYLLAMAIMLIPYLNSFLHVNLLLCMFLLVRDFPFEGRGIGKNLMGLQVVDAETGAPPTLQQSALRNVVLVGPALVQLATGILHFIPFIGFNEAVTWIVNVLGAVYVILVIPMEAYRAYNRPDGQRLGDQLAKTEVVESAMDFSKPLPRRM